MGERGGGGGIRRVGWWAGESGDLLSAGLERESEYTCNRSFGCEVLPEGLFYLAWKVKGSMTSRTFTRVVLGPAVGLHNKREIFIDVNMAAI